MNVFDLHKNTWQQLVGGRKNQAHAMLLIGAPGILKTELAYTFSASLLCETPKSTGEACQACPACNWFAQGNHPDFRWLRPAAMMKVSDTAKDEVEDVEGKDGKSDSKEITIAQVRALGDFLNVGTHRAGHRVILVSPAEAMNRNTANALLKSLEEPRPGTVFLLVSDRPEQLLPTVRSRCRSIIVPPPSINLSLGWLKEEGVNDSERWLALAGGAPKRARDISMRNHQALLKPLETQLARGDQINTVTLAAEIDKLLKADIMLSKEDVVDWTQRWVYDLLAVSTALPVRFFTTANDHLMALSTRTNLKKLLKFNSESVDFKKLSQHTLNNRLFFEDFFTQYSRLFAKEH